MSQTAKRKFCEIADNGKMESMTEVQSNGAVSLFRLAKGVIKYLLSFIVDDMMSRAVCEIKHANSLMLLSP